MAKPNELSALKREIAKARRQRGPRNRFDERLRERILKVAWERMAEGETAIAVSRELGLGRRTLEGWLPRTAGREAKQPKVVPVVLEEQRSERSVVLELGGGRVTGLQLEDVAELLRRLR